MLCSFAGLVCICIATLQFTFTIAVLCIQVCCCRSLLLKLKCLHVSKDRTRVCKQCLILATTCKRRLQKVFVSGLLLCRLAASQHTPDVRQQVHSRPRARLLAMAMGPWGIRSRMPIDAGSSARGWPARCRPATSPDGCRLRGLRCAGTCTAGASGRSC